MIERRAVVGIDGSDEALVAVQVATQDAARRRRGLKIVHAFMWPTLSVNVNPSEFGPPESGLRAEADRFVEAAANVAAKTDPTVPITTEVVPGGPSPVLLRQAREAEVIVVGSRGLGGFTGLLVGSVAIQVASRSPVPVPVVKGTVREEGPVVVGVDGSAESEATVAAAFAEAARRDAQLVALHTWTEPVVIAPGDVLPLVYDVDEAEGEEARVLSEALCGYPERYPDVRVRVQVVRARPPRP
jgi:nucleotide-binding universal stress UspA family protein